MWGLGALVHPRSGNECCSSLPGSGGRAAPGDRGRQEQAGGTGALSAHLSRGTWAASGRRQLLSFNILMLKSFVGLNVLQFSSSYSLALQQY